MKATVINSLFAYTDRREIFRNRSQIKTRHHTVMHIVLAGIFLFVLPAVPSRAALNIYETRYYTIHTDIDPDDVKEAAIRMTKMAEEYHERTKTFAGVIRTRLPFYLYKSEEDYYRAGGLPGSAGVFIYDGTGGKLMAVAGKKSTLETWHIVQHEGFHQFAHAVIGGQIPTWLNEGLAEYFGESIFTGDGFVTGVIPPWRLSRVQGEINDDKVKHLSEIMHVSGEQWAREMNIENYDEAWSMVHFLVHGDDQKYQGAFSACIREISGGKPFDRAWLDTIGPANGFETRWKAWWLAQPKSPTSHLYGRAAVATMTSFLARAAAEKQTFSDFAAFRTAATDDQLKMNPEDWLPRSLITNAMRLYGSNPGWELKPGPGKQPIICLTLADDTRVNGSFTLNGNRVDQIHVDLDEMATVLKDAQDLLDSGKKDDARRVVQTAMRANPKSAMIADAKKFMQAAR